MDRTERLYKIDLLVAERGAVTFDDLRAALEVSPATLKRDLQYLRDRLNCPLVWDRDARAYRYEGNARRFELPGLWFSAAEIHALLTMRELIANLDTAGLLARHIEPLMARLNGLLGATEQPAEAVSKRVRLLGVATRPVTPAHFETIGTALLRRHRLRLTYHARGNDSVSEREVSPQRLVHYRGNWYLDAWCHLRDGLRSFALDAVRQAQVLERAAQDCEDAVVDTALARGYGIFGGAPVAWAVLRFSPERSRWVAHEIWHPEQKSSREADGSTLLEVPYADHRELLMDILKHGPEVEVLAPPDLRERVAAAHARALARYRA